ncbi:phosphoenolpyruvate carboxykinase (GTP) [Schaalia sp. 19OD2882]|uniref:phosphoenolpyruvate carboxykinase (GTP) n=1 Tax=Schaalia sp. 19OD2882 TaxID=2794089 RepID=UPI001C1E9CE1|nr:phosphoenolpyruvate carboxykinase (GTP) [Schaalia sp. 19OD2882]QWW19056.1 phosphoenolpyruvate carboxykinase (GTP) [Schaalia sp. 19OD2882]
MNTPQIRAALDTAGVTTPAIRDFVEEWALLTTPDAIEVISTADDERLVAEALKAGEILPAGKGRHYTRSHPKDTARSEGRTVVATSRPEDQGVYNNWRHADEVVKIQRERMAGKLAGKTMYVIPYLMAVPGSPIAAWAAGVQLSDNRVVAIQIIRMARVGLDLFSTLQDPSFFVRSVHVTGDLDSLKQGTDEDERLFATIADQRLILHYGSAYGGNAMLGKIAHSLRQSSYDGFRSGKFLAEQFMLLGIVDKETGRTYHVCGGFPSASGKTNLAMTLPPDALGDRYRVEFYGDDITYLWVGEDGRLYGMNSENGVFGVAKDTNELTNPAALSAIGDDSGALFTNVAYNEITQEVWWEGRTPDHPAPLDGWLDWKGQRISERSDEDEDAPWAHPNSRFATPLTNVTTVAADASDPAGVPIDAVIFGGRTRDREPLIRAITDLAEGVYDGLTLGAEATFAAEGVEGMLRYDPMSMRPFMSYSEGDYAAHWLDVLGKLTEPPLFAHVNWFQRDAEDGHFLWPGYRENLRALLWLIDFQDGKAQGTKTPVGVVPTREELNLTGLELPEADLERILSIDVDRWKQELAHRGEHLARFRDLPEAITAVHTRIVGEFDR